jgi:hypothetical protein
MAVRPLLPTGPGPALLIDRGQGRQVQTMKIINPPLPPPLVKGGIGGFQIYFLPNSLTNKGRELPPFL